MTGAPGRGRLRWLGGVAVAAVAIGIGELVGALLDVPAPVASVAGAAIDAAPKPVKLFAVRTFGTSDKTALGIGIALLLVIAATAILTAAPRRAWARPAGIAAFAAIGLAAADARELGAVALLPTLVAAPTAGVAAWLVRDRRSSRDRAVGRRSAPDTTPDPPVPGDEVGGEAEREAGAPRAEPMVTTRWRAEVDRRAFAGRALALSVGGTAAGGIGRLLVGADESDLAAGVRLPAAPRSGPAAAPVVPATASVGSGVEPYLTPTADFYRIDTAFTVPRVDLASWRLRIDGLVDRPLTLSFEDLVRREVVERIVTLTCVSNEVGGDYIGTARWLGVPLDALLDEAGIRPGGEQVALTSVDGWTCGFPTALARDGRDAMVAIGMNGDPLPLRHGFPARVVVPGLYGYVSACKWIERIQLVGWNDFDGYWIPRGWSKEGPIKTQSRIDVPRDGDSVGPGATAIAGVAWAQHRGIRRVEVQVDDGAWRPARLAEEPTVDAWRQWILEWDATPGDHRIRVRATDGDDRRQTEREAPPDPDGATGWHTIRVTVA